jgi:predicted lipoprotein with Yx(FWY)xxD motif
MRKPQILVALAAGLALFSLALAGCGAANSGTGGYNYGPPAANTTAPTSSVAVVKTATATVNGQSVTILTNGSGDTLYYYKPDSATSSACTGGCASAWPPLLSPAGAPTSSANLPGKLGVLSDANGMQVTYNGHPLYTFANDTSAGMVTGNGVENFLVATVNLPVLSGSGGNAGPTPTCSGYYCH